MKTIKLVLTAGLIVLLIFPACKSSKNNTGKSAETPAENIPVNITESNNLFAFDLYKMISDESENIFYSPYSISTALAMTYSGARGKTEKEMSTVMHFPLNGAEFYNKYQSLIEEIKNVNDGSGANISTANSIWAQKDFMFKEDFINIIRNRFNSAIEKVDFINETEKSRIQINKWVESQTDDKIKDLIQPGLIDYLTRLVLVNAIYFKGDWKTAFDENSTKKMEFFVDKSTPVVCEFMTAETNYKFYEQEDGLKVIEIPYSKDNLSMLIFLPKDNPSFDALKKDMRPDLYYKILDGLALKKVKLFLPKFTTTSEFELSQVLQKMGMPGAFSDNADFSGMTGKKELKISKVIHKAFVEVNETGTEAAAATAVVVRVKSLQGNQPEFKADHPFMFIIKENRHNGILFAGNIYNPTK